MRRRRLRFLLLTLLLAGCGSTPEAGGAPCPPPPDPDRLASVGTTQLLAGEASRGAPLFAQECSRCHATDVSTRDSRFFREYPRLDCDAYLAQVTDRYLYVAIAEGGPAVGRKELMKPFRERLSEQQMADLVAQLRTGRAGRAPRPGPTAP